MTARHWTAVLVWCVLLGAGGIVLLTKTSFKAELSLLLPPATTPTQELLLNQVRAGPTTRLILIGLEGRNADVLAAASKRLAAWMRESKDFVYVTNGEQAWSTEELDLLFRYRYLLSPSVNEARFRHAGLRAAFEDRLRDLVSPLSLLVKERVAEDPTGEFGSVLQPWLPEVRPRRHHGVWLSSDGRRAILLGQTHALGFDLNEQERLQAELKIAFTQILSSMKTPHPIDLLISGPAVFSVEARKTIKQESWKLSVVAICLVVLFLYTAYRSWRLVALTIVPLVSAMIVSIAAVGLLFGFIHGITLAFGMTLIGVAIDYPIHLFSHLNSGKSAETVFERIWPTMRLGIITTVMGFSAMLLTGFPGLSQLGCFAMIGLLVAGSVTRWVLPALIPSEFQPDASVPRLVPPMDRMRKAYLMPPLAVLVATGYLILSGESLWEHDLANLSPVSREKKTVDRELRKELAAPDVRELIVITGQTEQEVLQISEELKPALDRLVTEDVLSGYEMGARHLPSYRRQRTRQAALPEPSILRHHLEVALSGLPFTQNAFEPFVAAVGGAKRQKPLDSARLSGTGVGLKLESLLFPREGQWVALVLLRGVTHSEQLVSMVKESNHANVTYVDLKGESNRLVAAYRGEALSLVGWGALAIGIVLLVGLRSMTSVLRVLLPISGSVLVVVALLHGVGERLSLFHLVSLLLVVGMGLDYALFFNRSTSTLAERERTIFSVLVCSVTTMLVFGILAWSEIPILRAIGMTAACGSLICLLFSALHSREPDTIRLAS